MKSVFEIADAKGRDYITPEDVTAALESGWSADLVRIDVLRAIAGGTNYGVEDASLTAFLAAEGLRPRGLLPKAKH